MAIVTDAVMSVARLRTGSGTVALPIVAPDADIDTGIYFPAANEVAIACGGTQRLHVDSAGGLFLSKYSTLEFVRSGTITNLTLVGSTTAGTPTYVTRSAAWRRIGPLVHVGFEVNISALGGLEGNVSIGGVLPFAALNATGYFSPAAVRPSNIGLTTNYVTHVVQTAPDSTSLFLQQVGDDVAAANVAHTLMNDDSRIIGSLVYITAAT